MRRVVRALLPQAARDSLREAFGARFHARSSYSQEGEDLLLARMFDDSSLPGIYVDVGAHHPFRFSNTALLASRGWRGINIDARPGSMKPFRRFRPRDVNLELGVSEMPAQLRFHVFAEPALNTFDADLAESRRNQGWQQTGSLLVECRPLAEILERHLPELGAATVDLLTVDVEGLDLQVLRSNDWSRFRPRVVLIEVLGSDIEQLIHSEPAAFLAQCGYKPVSKLVNSVAFVCAVPSERARYQTQDSDSP